MSKEDFENFLIAEVNNKAEGILRPSPYKDKENTVAIQFCGWEVILNKDGTYFLSDTTGG